MPQRRRQFARASRETAQFAKAGRSRYDGRRGRVGGSAHGELDGLTGGSLLQEIDDILAPDAAHVRAVHTNDHIPNAQTCPSSAALCINSLHGKSPDVFGKLDAIDELCEIKWHFAILAILKAELERSKPQKNRLATVDAHQHVGDLPRRARRSHLRWWGAEVGLRLHKLRSLRNADLRLQLLLLKRLKLKLLLLELQHEHLLISSHRRRLGRHFANLCLCQHIDGRLISKCARAKLLRWTNILIAARRPALSLFRLSDACMHGRTAAGKQGAGRQWASNAAQATSSKLPGLKV